MEPDLLQPSAITIQRLLCQELLRHSALHASPRADPRHRSARTRGADFPRQAVRLFAGPHSLNRPLGAGCTLTRVQRPRVIMVLLRGLPHSLRHWRSRCRESLHRSLFRLHGLAALRLRHRAQPLCTRLDAACGPFSALASEIEHRFLACGSALQEQVKLTSRLSAQSRQLNELGARSDRGETAIQRVMLRLTTHLDLGDRFARESERLAATLDDYAQHLQQLLQDQQRLERSFAPMRALHSFFRIESASLPPELQSLFQAVTTEMRRLHEEVSASFAEHTTALSGTRHQVLVAAAQLRTHAAEHLAISTAKRQEVQHALADLAAKLAQQRRRQEQLGTAITALDRETDKITVSLQYQDITRQKMEHVREAARAVLDGFAPADRTPVRQRAIVQRMLCQVQTVQLDSVQQELEQATATITSGLRALLDQLDRIESECLSLDQLHAITADMDATIAALADIHRVTAGLMQSSLARLTAAIQTARGFSAATTGATDTMRRLAADLLLMGLNAQVQALQANNNCLEVLAGAVSHISSEAGTLTLAFEHKLADTTQTLARFVHRSEAFHQEILAGHEALHAENGSVAGELDVEHAAHQALVKDVGAALRQLRAQAGELLASIALADISREPIRDLREIFAALSVVCGEAVTDAQPLDEQVLADVRSRYTMDSERAAHAAALSLPAAAMAVAAVPALAEPALKAAPGPSPAAPAEPGASLGDNVELF